MWTQRRFHVSSAAPVVALLLSFADSLSIQHLPRDLVERAVDDNFTPHDPPFVWYALGDSYTAGPGAGNLDPSNSGDCVRSLGSYAPQLSSDWLYNGGNQLNFLACTGAVTDNVASDQLPEISSDPPPDFVVMTLGGNDIGFSKIAKACLIGLITAGNCDDKIADARNVIKNRDDPFWTKLEQIYDGIFDQMPHDMHYQMFHIGYTKFFNTDPESTWCNGQTFGKVGLSGLFPPKLTFDLRNKLNQLTDDWNAILHAHLLGYANKKLNEVGDGKWEFQRIWFAAYDSRKQPQYSFGGHLFCEPGVEDAKFQDPSTWIFGVWGKQKDTTSSEAGDEVGPSAFASIDSKSCQSDPKYNDDDAFGWDCDMAVYYADPDTEHNVTTVTGLDFTRSFHPKSAGFTHLKDYLAIKMKAVRRAPQNNQCIDAPPTDLDEDSAIQSGFPKSICANGAGALSTALNSANPPTATATATPTSASSQTSTASTPLGTCASKCNCNEDSCTDDSPTCCPNGTCDNNC